MNGTSRLHVVVQQGKPSARRRVACALLAIFAAGWMSAASLRAASLDIATIYSKAVAVNESLFYRTPDRTVYVSTGDIDAMWLRDSSVQALSRLRDRDLVRGVIARQERLIAIDPYANAFHRDYTVAEAKFELDSLCYPVMLAEKYVRATGDRSIYDGHFYGELHVILKTLVTEQRHTRLSSYHRNEHPVKDDIGLVWSAYRPSDDPQVYNYNVPENMFAEKTLRDMAVLFRSVYHDQGSADLAAQSAQRIRHAIEKYAVFRSRRHGWIYAYEIDGLGHAKFMDDANVPSLLSIPLLGYPYDRRIYANTRAFVLSPGNPYYYRGRYADGIGSAHTPRGYVWPMSLIVEYRTASGERERERVLRELAMSNAGDGALHESFNVNDPRRFTRSKFGWVNALFAQTFLKRQEM